MIRTTMSSLLAIIVLLAATISPAAEAGTFNVQVLLPGITKSIDIRQQEVLPLGCPQFFIFTVGSGMLGISLKKDDVDGDSMFMAGFIRTGGRIVPVRRVGISSGMIEQTLQLEGDASTIGFGWIWCGVAASQNVPVYRSELRLSMQP